MDRWTSLLFVAALLASGCARRPAPSEASGPGEEPTEVAVAEGEGEELAKPNAFPEKALAMVADALSDQDTVGAEDITRFVKAHPEITGVADEATDAEEVEKAAKKHGYESYNAYQLALGDVAGVYNALKALMNLEESMAGGMPEPVLSQVTKSTKTAVRMAKPSRKDLERAYEQWDALARVLE